MTNRIETLGKRDKDIDAIKVYVRAFDPEPDHGFQVCAIVMKLFNALTDMHSMGRAERRLLEAAALLHDIGHTISPLGHHKHARDIILDLEFEGFSENDVHMIACIARYHRKTHPRPRHKTFCDLSNGDQDIVRRLSALLRIADGLDRGHEAATRGIHTDLKESALTIRVDQRRPSEIDIWGAMRKRALFEEVFEVSVSIETAPSAANN